MIDTLIVLGWITGYAVIGGLVFGYLDSLCGDEYEPAQHVGALLWPLALFYLIVLHKPIQFARGFGSRFGTWQLAFANARMEKRLAIRHELEEANRQLRIEMAKDPLMEQFDELERKESSEYKYHYMSND